MTRFTAVLLFTLIALSPAYGEPIVAHKVTTERVNYEGRDAIRVVESDVSTDEDKIAVFPGSNLKNGTISGYVSGNVRKDAGPQARGFAGIAFRIDPDVSSFEAVYLRPANARAEDQLRRNHSMQYISHPDFPWHRLRRETPGKYESYADMVPGDWIHYRLEIKGTSARLYLNEASQPVLIINDLKLGERSGQVGLWIGPGTEAHFSGINITPK